MQYFGYVNRDGKAVISKIADEHTYKDAVNYLPGIAFGFDLGECFSDEDAMKKLRMRIMTAIGGCE
jgi:hypothetical protein